MLSVGLEGIAGNNMLSTGEFDISLFDLKASSGERILASGTPDDDLATGDNTFIAESKLS